MACYNILRVVIHYSTRASVLDTRIPSFSAVILVSSVQNSVSPGWTSGRTYCCLVLLPGTRKLLSVWPYPYSAARLGIASTSFFTFPGSLSQVACFAVKHANACIYNICWTNVRTRTWESSRRTCQRILQTPPRLHNPESCLWSSLSVPLTRKGPGLTPVQEPGGVRTKGWLGLTARA